MRLGNFGKIGIGWAIITVAGIGAFVISKNSIDRRRYDDMKVRERMKKSNFGDYEVKDTKRFDI